MTTLNRFNTVAGEKQKERKSELPLTRDQGGTSETRGGQRFAYKASFFYHPRRGPAPHPPLTYPSPAPHIPLTCPSPAPHLPLTRPLPAPHSPRSGPSPPLSPPSALPHSSVHFPSTVSFLRPPRDHLRLNREDGSRR